MGALGLEVLSRVELFKFLPQRSLKIIARACSEREFREGDAIMEEGNSGLGLFIILQGRVSVRKRQEGGGRSGAFRVWPRGSDRRDEYS